MILGPLQSPPKDPVSLADRVARAIRQLVVDSRLGPGDRLPPERELAQRLSVSRPVLREALKTLEARRYITVRHGQGAFVGVDPAGEAEMLASLRDRYDLDELCDMWEILEATAAGWAAERATHREIEALARTLLVEEQDAGTDPDDRRALERTESDFHNMLFEIADNRLLIGLFVVLRSMIGVESGMHPARFTPSGMCGDHRAIFDAIRRGDVAAAQGAARSHVRRQRDAITTGR